MSCVKYCSDCNNFDTCKSFMKTWAKFKIYFIKDKTSGIVEMSLNDAEFMTKQDNDILLELLEINA